MNATTPDTKPREILTANLDDLDDRWLVTPQGGRRRAIGGKPGQRWASDGGSMVIIGEDEYTDGLRGDTVAEWRELTLHDLWHEKTSKGVLARRVLCKPDEFGPIGSRVGALRFGDTWLSVQYVDIAMRLGGTEVHLSGPRSEAVIPGLMVFMPVVPDDEGES